ncbi:hypothetical protein JCM10908_003121 [Rhodotorula pacifica]|uniref:uncharacterized protein n=1 Tax=Rhodotorula pacifica TaxID=1495444 RepID=UPI00316C3F4A
MSSSHGDTATAVAAQVSATAAPAPIVCADAAPTKKEELAAQAVAAKGVPADHHHLLLSPPLLSILESYSKDGQGDAELLKLVLHAKAKEDERLASLDALRAEQLRAANTLAMYTYYAQMSQIAAIQQQAVPPPLQMAPPTSKPLPPYQPLSPPCEPTHIVPLSHSGGKRSRASSESASEASSESSTGKKAKTSPPSSASSITGGRSASPPALALGPAGRVSHADVMAALRRKCEANQQQAAAKAAARPSTSSPRAIAPRPPTVTSRASSVASNASTSGSTAPASAPSSRRKSSPQAPVGRHTAFLRTVTAPPAPEDVAAPASPVSPANEAVCTSAAAVEPPVTSTRNKLALLLHASESSAAQMSHNWHPTATAATSDVRGSAQAA